MLSELLKVTPWWVWLIVVLGGVLVFCLAVVMPVALVAKRTPRGSRERVFVYQLGACAGALALLNCALCLLLPTGQESYSALCLFALLLLTPWAIKKQQAIREAESKTPRNSTQGSQHSPRP